MREWSIHTLELVKKISPVINVPYIDFGFIKATPALVFFVAYVFLFVITYCYNVKNNGLRLQFLQWNSYSEGRKKSIIRAMGGFAVGCVVCWIIPPFFDEESLLVKICKNYLEYEPIIAVVIFGFLCSALLTVKNRDKHVEVVNKILQFMLPISVGIGLFERYIDLHFWPNWIVIILAYVVYFMLLVMDSEMVEAESTLRIQSYDISYNPVEKVEQLFPQHKAQAERIANIISEPSSDPISICLSGEWGKGKTSVVNGVEKLFDGNDRYAFIRINAMELDNKNTLLNYFMGEVKSCLEERGVYVGIASEYAEFLASMVGAVTTSPVGSLFQNRIFGGEKDYREQKRKLEKLLVAAFGEGKLVLIIDDIERCQADVARDYLFLIKEVATMKKCVSIFVTDYNVLLNLLQADTNNLSNKEEEKNTNFLEKFFNYTINLYDETPEDIFTFYDRSFKEEDPVFKSIYEIIGLSPGTWYKHALEKLDLKIREQEDTNMQYHLSEENKIIQENKLKGMKEKREAFMKYMQNPRSTVKFYNAFRRNMHRCHSQFFGFVTQENEKSLVSRYVRTRNIGQIVAFLSFLEVCLPDELQQIIKQGADYIKPVLYEKDVIISKDREFVREIASVTIYREDSEFQTETSYIMMEKQRFINRFLNPKYDLQQLIKPFDSREAEWKHAIENGIEESIDLHWNEMVNMVLEKMPNNTPDITEQWKEDTFSYLIEYADRKVGWGTWNIDKVFSIFGEDKRGRLFASGKRLLQIFWDRIQEFNVPEMPSEEIVNDIINFSVHYAYNKIDSTYKLIRYISSYEQSDKMKNIKDRMLDSSQKMDDNLLRFVNQIGDCVPELSLPNGGWHEKLQVIINYIQDYLEKHDFLKYEDVNEMAGYMLDSVNELECMSKILKWLQKENHNDQTEELCVEDYSKINTTIQYFENILGNLENNYNVDVEKQFTSFFLYLRDTSDIRIDETEIEQLQNLITLLVKETGRDSLFYRKILLQISLRNTTEVNAE